MKIISQNVSWILIAISLALIAGWYFGNWLLWILGAIVTLIGFFILIARKPRS